MTTRARLIGLVAVLLGLVGCASGPAGTASDATAAPSITGTLHPQGNSPPPEAVTPCGDAVREQVRAALGLDSVPAPESSWADNLVTCTYRTPDGPLVYVVKVESTFATARDFFAGLRERLGTTRALDGLDQAFSNDLGIAIALWDNLVLAVDASELPAEHLGLDDQSQTGVARLLAAGVVHGWLGHD